MTDYRNCLAFQGGKHKSYRKKKNIEEIALENAIKWMKNVFNNKKCVSEVVLCSALPREQKCWLLQGPFLFSDMALIQQHWAETFHKTWDVKTEFFCPPWGLTCEFSILGKSGLLKRLNACCSSHATVKDGPTCPSQQPHHRNMLSQHPT